MAFFRSLQNKLSPKGWLGLAGAALLALALLWGGPAGADKPAPAASPAAGGGAGEGLPLVIMLEAAPKTLEPLMATDAYGVRISHQLIFQTLVELGDDLAYQPGVASGWKKVNPTLWRFYIRPGLRFHHGAPLTAQDVAHTLALLMGPQGSPYGGPLKEKIAHVRVTAPLELEISLKAPYASLLGDLTVPVVSRDPKAPPLSGSGPFRFGRSSPNQIELEAYPGYHGPQGGPAKAPRLIFKVVKDANTRLLKMRKGDIDLAINAIPLDKLNQFERGPMRRSYQVIQAPGLSFQYLGFNHGRPPLNDPRVRRALAMAIQMEPLIKFLQKGKSVRANGLFPQGSPYAISQPPPEYNPQQAARLLDQAGWPMKGDRRFELVYKTTTDRAAVAQARVIARDLAKVGVVVEVRAFEWGTYYEDIQRGNFELFSLRWIGVSDPDFLFELFHSSKMPPQGRNRMRYANPAMDNLLERARLEQDEAARRRLYLEAQTLAAQELAWLPLWHNQNVAVVSRRVLGFQLHPSGGFQHLWQTYKQPLAAH